MADLVLGAGGAAATAYTIDQSLRFDDGDSPSLTKTFASAGDRKTWTFSAWVKLGLNGEDRSIFTAGPDSNDTSQLLIRDDDKLYFFSQTSSIDTQLLATPLYRDPGAWAHIVCKYDSTPATPDSTDVALFVNGSQVTAFDIETYPSQNDQTHINDDVAHYISRRNYDDAKHWDGYIAEVYFIDGQALDADSFAETDEDTNQWKPIDASGLTFGTNGFYQKYAGTELATDIQDSSGSSGVTIEVNGNTHTDTTIKKIGTASAQFDGTGDYLYLSSAAGASSIGPDTGSFTIECWIYRSGTQTQMVPFGAYNSWVRWETHVDGDWNLMLGWDGTERHVGGTWSVDTWYHIALVGESGGEFRFYVDGVLKHTGTKDTSMNWHNGFSIGDVYNKQGGSSAYDFEGYIDEFRISDSVRYVSNFTPSTTEFTPDSNTKLLMHMDGANDGTSFPINANKVITPVGDVANTRAEKKVGDSSIYFDGSGDYLTTPASSDFNFGTDAFTIEAWLYRKEAYANLFGYYTLGSGSTRWAFEHSDTNVGVNVGGSWYYLGDPSSSTDTWEH